MEVKYINQLKKEDTNKYFVHFSAGIDLTNINLYMSESSEVKNPLHPNHFIATLK